MNKKTIIIIPLLIAVSVAAGILIGNLLKQNSQPAFNPMSYGNTNKLTTILELIDKGYVDSVNTNEIIESTIPDILNELDPHTAYIPAERMQEVREEMQGNFSGIGVQFSIQEDTVRVIEVISGGPSSKVGILPGDRIVRVNDSLIAGVDVETNTVMELLRGEKSSKVTVGVIRKGADEELEFEITRDDIPLFSVDVSYMINPETGFIKVSRFAETTYDEFMNGMQKLNGAGAKKVIVDLRQNPGGSLQGVLKIVDEFLDKGEPILYTEGINQPRKTYNASGRNSLSDVEVYVLIDEFSASASEILAGALQDNDRGIVIGRRSFGKGLVQEQIPLMDGSALRLTVARFYTPSGRCIQKSYEEGNEEYFNDLYARFSHREQLVADSINFNDSLKYTTSSGRTVYGGGGIMPDIFVPMDTTGNSEYYNKIYRKGLIYTFAYAYADRNREALSRFSEASEFDNYLANQNILNEFVEYATEKGIQKDAAGLKESERIISTQLKAYIARNIIGEEGFYPIISQIDNTLLKAIEIAEKNLLVENLTQPDTPVE
ncbi:carboxyl-terminal processing protease [Tangfeifania diversioriginum]|uniref:Carboxyl-terminal processing protease n=1 Tax=Tangfeifania diversioriginum TaxID=1168035 RepID=A0A1M6IA65_9BACT|nr:S41 family peptidase [Tangfeifania diversioriginum]SHJ31302.1 carboxyl-terminal processing protease [Tangfeifania diversioriginum]